MVHLDSSDDIVDSVHEEENGIDDIDDPVISDEDPFYTGMQKPN